MSDVITTYSPKGKDVYDRNELHAEVLKREKAELDLQRQAQERKIGKDEPTVGLAISGGGIRSATFGLGVMEALKKKGVLEKVDYLSTVSGGGYIGSWLTTNCLRNGGWAWTRETKAWDTSIRHLRRYSNYLSPQLGFFSADSWSIATIWIRNTMLIQVTILLGLLAIFLVPQMLLEFFEKWPSEHNFRFITFLLFGMGVVGAAGNLLDMQRPYLWVLTAENWLKSAVAGGVPLALGISGYIWLQRVWWGDILISLLLLSGMFLLLPVAVKLYATGQKWMGTQEALRAGRIRYGQSLTQALLVAPMMIAAYLIASVMSGQAYWEFSSDTYSTILAEAMGRWWLPFSFAVFTFVMLSLSLLKKGSGMRGAWGVVLGVVSASGVLYLMFGGIIYLVRVLFTIEDTYWSCQILVPALVLYAFSVSVVVMIGMVGSDSSEGAREWWSRMAAWLGIYGFAWTMLSAFSAYLPWMVLQLGGIQSWGSLSGIVVTTLTGLWAGRSSSTGPSETKKKSKVMELVASVAPFVFIVGLLGGTAMLLYSFEVSIVGTNAVSYWQRLSAIRGYAFGNYLGFDLYLLPTLLGCLMILTAAFASRVDLNEFSLNAFYRSRLGRCYLGASRLDAGESPEADQAETTRKPHPFTGFDEDDDVSLKDLRYEAGFRGPLHIVNCALNLGGAGDLAVQSRQAANFQFSPLFCGSNRESVRLVDTKDYSGAEADAAPTLAQVMSVSGAAASPNMGYHSSTPVAFLLTMFNVRLGWWFGNPSKGKRGNVSPEFSLRYLAVELMATATPDSNYLMISDGGHFENLAVYELVRRKTRVILCCDAEADASYGFEGMGRLIRMCAVDFGAKIEIDLSSVRPDARTGRSRAHCAVGRIDYAGSSPGWLVYMKASWKGNEGEAMQQYRSANPQFPHESTGDQFYSEEQFESYRALGCEAGLEAFERFSGKGLLSFVSGDLRSMLSPELRNDAPLTRHTARLNELYARLGSEAGLAGIAWQFVDGIASEPALTLLSREQQYFCMEVLQLMEDVFVDANLESHFTHPDTQGWLNTFRLWVRSTAMQDVWAKNQAKYGERFATFLTRLKESRVAAVGGGAS